MICVRDCDTANPKNFEQPVLQTYVPELIVLHPSNTLYRAQMFVGESGCWILVFLFSLIKRASRSRGYTPIPSAQEDTNNAVLKPLIGKDGRRPLKGWATLLLSLPSTCDIIGTTLMNGGLLFVAASIYQMTRGALVLFVGVFSVIFLKRRLFAYQWFALVVVVTGVAIVGLAGAMDKGDVISQTPPPPMKQARAIIEAAILNAREAANEPVVWKTVIGVLMIAGAQIFTATQFVLEEHILERYSIEPLKMVGWEGLFGFSLTLIGMIILHLLIGRTDAGRNGYFDAVEGWREFINIPGIFLSSILIMISIGGFNFFGLSVTRTVSATSRSTIDTCRTLFIWIVSLGLGWESFKWLQIVGFALLVYGTFLFNDLVGVPWACCVRSRIERQREPLLEEEPIEHS